MACVTAITTFLGLTAMGGALAGAGLSNMGGGIASNIGGLASSGATGALSAIKGATSSAGNLSGLMSLPGGALGNLTSGVGGAFTSFGNDIAGGALSNGIGGPFSSIGGGTFTAALGEHAGELFGSSPIQAMQTFNAAEAFSSASQGLAGSLSSMLGPGGVNFGQAVSSLQQTLPIAGDFGNFLGSSIPNLQGIVTNGLSTLTSVVKDMPNFAQELSNLGTAFDLGNLTEFGNPGQLIQQISSVGGLDVTGISNALQQVGLGDVSISSLSNPIFNAELTDALGFIQNPQMIANAQSLLGSAIPVLNSMADFTNMATVMPISFDSIPFDDFTQFGEHLQGVELGSLANTSELGGLLQAVTTVDLPTILNTTQVMDNNALANLTSNFLGGTGANGGILTTDIMGTLGGIGLTAPYELFSDAINTIDAAGGFNAVNTLYGQMTAGINGDYLDIAGDFDASTKITDPNGGAEYEELDKFVQAKAGQISSAIQGIADAFPTETGVASSPWAEMQRKVFHEDLHQAKVDLGLDIRNNDSQNAYHFVTSHQDRASRRDVISIIEGMQDFAVSNGDVFGEHWRAFTAEMKNRNNADSYNIRWRGEDLDEFEVI